MWNINYDKNDTCINTMSINLKLQNILWILLVRDWKSLFLFLWFTDPSFSIPELQWWEVKNKFKFVIGSDYVQNKDKYNNKIRQTWQNE